MFNNYNPYYTPQLPQMQRLQQIEQQYAQYAPQPMQPIRQPIQGLQGKSVDNVEVVKAMDIPLDGSISYFPIADGTAIVTKQLQPDGTSRTIVYTPNISEQKQPTPSIELEEINKKIDDIKAMLQARQEEKGEE